MGSVGAQSDSRHQTQFAQQFDFVALPFTCVILRELFNSMHRMALSSWFWHITVFCAFCFAKIGVRLLLRSHGKRVLAPTCDPRAVRVFETLNAVASSLSERSARPLDTASSASTPAAFPQPLSPSAVSELAPSPRQLPVRRSYSISVFDIVKRGLFGASTRANSFTANINRRQRPGTPVFPDRSPPSTSPKPSPTLSTHSFMH